MVLIVDPVTALDTDLRQLHPDLARPVFLVEVSSSPAGSSVSQIASALVPIIACVLRRLAGFVR